MKLSKSARALFAIIIISSLLGGLGLSFALGQSRRQPPPSTEKKNKRPTDTGQQGEKPEEPVPPDLIGKPQEAEKITVTTQIVNVDAVVYHKKGGQIVTGLKKENFAIFADGVPQTITNFSTPEAPITVAMVVEYSKWSELFGAYGNGGYFVCNTKFGCGVFGQGATDGVGGHFEATGIRPTFMTKLEQAGVRLPSSAFKQRTMLVD